jgi:hypothetical protein
MNSTLTGREQVIRWVTVLAVVTVAVIAAIQSYSHMHDLAFSAGEQWRSHLFPISVDGLVVAASMVLLSQQIMTAAGRVVKLSHRMFAASALTMGVMVSLSANIADAWDRGLLPRAIAGWPAVAFAVVFHLLLIQWKSTPVIDSVTDVVTTPLDTVPVVTVEPVVSIPVVTPEPVVKPVTASVTQAPPVIDTVTPVVKSVNPVKPSVTPRDTVNDNVNDTPIKVTRKAVITTADVQRLTGEGLTPEEIADKFSVSPRTVYRRLASSMNGHVTS